MFNIAFDADQGQVASLRNGFLCDFFTFERRRRVVQKHIVYKIPYKSNA